MTKNSGLVVILASTLALFTGAIVAVYRLSKKYCPSVAAKIKQLVWKKLFWNVFLRSSIQSYLLMGMSLVPIFTNNGWAK